MRLSEAHRFVIRQFWVTFPHPPMTDEAARGHWTHQLCEQLAYSFPDQGWCHKRQRPGYPHSKDCIAWLVPFIGWDIVSNTGQLILNGDPKDLVGQVPEPVTPINHLAEPSPEPPAPPPLPDLTARVEALEGEVEALKATFRAAGAIMGRV